MCACVTLSVGKRLNLYLCAVMELVCFVCECNFEYYGIRMYVLL